MQTIYAILANFQHLLVG